MDTSVALFFVLLTGSLPADSAPVDNKLPAPAGVVLRIATPELLDAGRIHALAFSPNGRSLVAASEDGRVRLLDVATGRLIRRFAGHRGPVKSLALTADGKVLASAGADAGIRLWNLANGELRRRLDGHDGAIEALACSPDGKLLASAGADKIVRVWRIDDGRKVYELTGHQQMVRTLAFASGGRTLASAGHDRSVRLWNMETGKEAWRFWTPGWVYSLSFSGDGKLLASGGRDQAIHLWELPSGTRLDSLGGYDGPIAALALYQNGQTVVAGTEDKKIRLWQTRSHKLRRELDGHAAPLLALTLSPNVKLLASADSDGQILIWELDGAEFLWLDLGSLDESAARDAFARLAAAPGTVSLLHKHLQPLLEITFRMDALIADLGSEQFRVRARATQELEKLGKTAQSALREGLRDDLSLEVRRRIEHLLGRFAAEDGDLHYSDRLRISRTVTLLERLGSPEARRVLETLAAAPPNTRLTREVQASLRRLGKKPGP